LAMVRHSRTIEAHYLLALLPALPLTIGLFVAALADRAELVATLAREPARLAARWLPALALAALVAAQIIASTTLVASMRLGAYTGPQAFTYIRYGIPLDVQQAGLRATATVARAAHARAYVAATTWGEPGFGYLAAAAGLPVSVYDGTSCVLAPSPGTRPAVVLAMAPLPADTVFAGLAAGNSRPAVSGQFASQLRLYTLAPGAHLAGETALPVASGAQPRLAGYRLNTTADGVVSLVLHWSGSPPPPTRAAADLAFWRGAMPGTGALASYTFTLQPVGSLGQRLGPALSETCSVLHWGAGEDLYTWITLPAARSGPAAPAGWQVAAERQEYSIVWPAIGPLRLETGDLVLGTPEPLATTVTIPAPAHG
ncbi:MAG: hypothetical protein ACHQ4H_14170, partial [Ktedonobacterales bacterium]